MSIFHWEILILLKNIQFEIMLLEKYNPNWSFQFESLKFEIEKGFLGFNFTIEHIGSTSVPDLDSKPIIDMDIVYFQKIDFEKIKSALEEMGYYHNGNQGIENRDVFKRKACSSISILDTIRHHLYVCPERCEALERHLLSRNFLRNNEWARLKYEQMKYELAEKANQDKKNYANLKELHVNEFIDFMVAQQKLTI
jgi:GrpB-like predicted nucleotidyltransferase (UPF0157 family)